MVQQMHGQNKSNQKDIELNHVNQQPRVLKLTSFRNFWITDIRNSALLK
jgi:hypothetical protein